MKEEIIEKRAIIVAQIKDIENQIQSLEEAHLRKIDKLKQEKYALLKNWPEED